ncbi:hypothetical protein [Pelomonas sp. KK5]|uniref:hypothetical protein n=1 Tax=Pelomonas sp. KK5 TaxID=1855730 RepID=UPI00097C41D8|nr:hypothetical protein [Pelomonas sp. KK5]
MFTRQLKRLIGATLATAALATLALAATPAFAAKIELSYLPPIIGIEMQYRGMGYADANGDFISLAGATITSATVKVDFTVPDGFDVSGFHMDMAVPVINATSQYFAVEGTDLVQLSPNHYSYSLTTSDFNGQIVASRFAIETYGIDADGNAVGWPASVDHSTGFYFTVNAPTAPVPEASSAMMLLAGLGVVPVLVARRRRHRDC